MFDYLWYIYQVTIMLGLYFYSCFTLFNFFVRLRLKCLKTCFPNNWNFSTQFCHYLTVPLSSLYSSLHTVLPYSTYSARVAPITLVFPRFNSSQTLLSLHSLLQEMIMLVVSIASNSIKSIFASHLLLLVSTE